MAKEASLYKQQFIARVRMARLARGLTQPEIAEVLQIKQDKYKQYETRSMLPHYLVPSFCTVCAIDIGWLFTGRGRGPTARGPTPTPSLVRTETL